jgi:hypothetical protein
MAYLLAHLGGMIPVPSPSRDRAAIHGRCGLAADLTSRAQDTRLNGPVAAHRGASAAQMRGS